MSKLLVAGSAFLAVLAGAAAGYRIGAGSWPNPQSFLEKASAAANATLPERSGRAVLYWKDPDGKADFSPTPKKTGDGRDYEPVYEDEEAGFTQPKQAAAPAKGGSRKILYYRNPMGLADTSPVPKKDWMGMDYIPVYEGEEQDSSAVRVSLDRVQRAGVRTEEVRLQRLARPVRAPGIAKPDERTLRIIALRADGFIEKLYVNETGQHIKAGEPLFRVYSSQMVNAQVDYRISAGDRSPATRDISLRGAEQKLRNLDLPASVLAELRRTGEPVMSIEWPSPVAGVVMEKRIVEGQMARMGEELYRISDLSSVWVIADVAEQDTDLVKVGAPAHVRFRALPLLTFEGRVTFVLHELNAATRTAKVRIEVKNPEHRIKHEMFADVEIDAGAGDDQRPVVPVSSVIDSGARQVVIVDRGEGRFEPRVVKLGIRGENFVEVREGLKTGEKVVVSANFLIDAESNLKAALQGFTAESAGTSLPSKEGGESSKQEKAR
jgi:Cu(I)/Ag(I) efflux system membrane fusion protein